MTSSTWLGSLLGCALLLVGAAACGDDAASAAPLDLRLDPASNVVTKAPSAFTPREGGLGQGTYEKTLPYTTLVLTGSKLQDVGETSCGQFAAETEDLELKLYGPLAAGTYPLLPPQTSPRANAAELRFGQNDWTSGTVTIAEGSEVRGTRVRGRIEAKGTDGNAASNVELELSFDALFSGCGRD